MFFLPLGNMRERGWGFRRSQIAQGCVLQGMVSHPFGITSCCVENRVVRKIQPCLQGLRHIQNFPSRWSSKTTQHFFLNLPSFRKSREVFRSSERLQRVLHSEPFSYLPSPGRSRKIQAFVGYSLLSLHLDLDLTIHLPSYAQGIWVGEYLWLTW